MKKITLITALFAIQLFANDLTIGVEALERGDFKTAFTHLKIAAEQGDPIAQQNLAVLYNNGIGVKKDRQRAAFWMEKTSDGSNTATVALH